MKPLEFQRLSDNMWPEITKMTHIARGIIVKYVTEQGDYYIGEDGYVVTDQDEEDGICANGDEIISLDNSSHLSFLRYNTDGKIEVGLTKHGQKWTVLLDDLAESTTMAIGAFLADYLEE